MIIRSIVLLLVVVVLWCSANSKDVRKSSQHNTRSLHRTRTKYKRDGETKNVGYHFYGGKKITLPIDKTINTYTNKVVGQRNQNQQRNFEKKSKFSLMHRVHKKRRNNHLKPQNAAQVQPWKTYSTNAVRKDSLVDLLQTFNAKNSSQNKKSNDTEVPLQETQNEKKENANVTQHEVLEKANAKHSWEKIDAEEIKKGIGKIVSQLQTVLKQDYVFLGKNITKPEDKKKKVDLKKLVADVLASQNNKSDGGNEDSIMLSPQQKLKVSDLQIPKDLNINGNSEEQNEMMNAQAGMGINGWNEMNQMNPMNGMQNVNGLNSMNPMNPVNEIVSSNRFNGMNYMMGANGHASPNRPMTMNNLPGMDGINNDVPDDKQIQQIMLSRFRGHEAGRWPSAIRRPPLEDYQDVEDEEVPQYHNYPRHRPRYYRPYEEDEDVRYGASRYRDEEDDVDRAQSKEYDNADERATIRRHLHSRKHRFNDEPRLKKSFITGKRIDVKKPMDNTRIHMANIKNNKTNGNKENMPVPS